MSHLLRKTTMRGTFTCRASRIVLARLPASPASYDHQDRAIIGAAR
jgi:hypothetical protein